MINIHAYINNAKDKGTALDKYIRDISKRYKIIFLDELHIFNIVDALLIKKIFLLFQKINNLGNFFKNVLRAVSAI